MIEDILKESKDKMIKSINNMKSEFSSIRSGRAHSSMLDHVNVEAYGSSMTINQLGTITIPEPRSILIQAYDKNILGEIEKALLKSDLGINPVNDGNVLRINLPELTEERRKEMVKLVKAKEEEAKVAVRNIRRSGNEHIKTLEKSDHLSEDEVKHGLDDMQKLTGEFINQVDELTAQKEKDIMTV